MLVPGVGLMAVVEKRSSREFVFAWDACCRRGWTSKIECSYDHRRIMHTQREEGESLVVGEENGRKRRDVMGWRSWFWLCCGGDGWTNE
jgi:hypothetical protein